LASSPPRCSCRAYASHRDLHSFPTRRSSDLQITLRSSLNQTVFYLQGSKPVPAPQLSQGIGLCHNPGRCITDPDIVHLSAPDQRSEEHTSELQSRENLVCRLLLEKKNGHGEG